MQEPTPHQTDIYSVETHTDSTEAPPDAVVTTNGNGNGHSNGNGKANGKARVPAATAAKSARPAGAPGLTIERRFTTPGVDVYETVEWEMRDAVISNERGEKVFEQKNVEIPKTWTQLATNVVVSKYFRGHIGTPERESSVRQLIGRVADTMTQWGRGMDYFATDADAQTFRDELTHILLYQKAAFNSPVWFNVGVKDTSQQCSACQPYEARVLTEKGPLPIGQIVTENQLGLRVFDGEGLTEIVGVKNNGSKPVFRIELTDGYTIEATADHLVCAHNYSGNKRLEWKRVDQLHAGMKMRVYPHTARTYVPATNQQDVSEAALAGWLQADGFVGQYETGTNRSLTIEFLTNGEAEREWVLSHLAAVFPDVHYHLRDVETAADNGDLKRIRLYGEALRPFIMKYDLLRRGTTIRVPDAIFTASEEAGRAYLISVFQAEGYISLYGPSARVGLGVISGEWVRDMQTLLTRYGIYARRYRKTEKRTDRHHLHVLEISILSERVKFARCIGFLSEKKSQKLLESLGKKGNACPDIRYSAIKSITPLGEMTVFDIQTRSGKYLSEGVLVHNCFINSVEDTMESILGLAKTEGMLFKFGSGTGTNLSTLRASTEPLQGGGTASGPISFMRGFDQFAGAIKSGGKTRRAAKMVMLDIDHPDILDFIQCKEKEEKKAWALIDAGYSGAFNVPGGAYDSVSFQNANHSVRVSDAFMQTYEKGGDWQTKFRLSSASSQSYKARDLMQHIGQSAWVCGDPGMQYDTTINKWHTCKNTDRIYASNPCSEYMFLNDSACNLSSLNLMKFRHADGEFDVEAFLHACRIMITAQEIIVDNADYPTPRIAENSRDYRPLGLGYANLGALLMARGLAYDSDEGRAYAGALTAIMTGEAYHQSAIIARDHGWPFPGYPKNREPFLDVMRMHRAAVEDVNPEFVPDELLSAARTAWDHAIEQGCIHGFRNAQATVLAPTGTIGFLMDCDTTGIEPDIAIVKYKSLVGGGVLKIVNNTVPEALTRLGYEKDQRERILAYIGERDTIEGSPDLKDEHLSVFDCAFKPGNGERSIHYMGHVKMMAAAQPFISGAISKTVNMPHEATVEEIIGTYVEGWKLGLKAIAIYRDGSKRTQPLMTTRDHGEKKEAKAEVANVEAIPAPVPQMVAKPLRRKLPDERASITHKFSIAGHEGYITVGMYQDGTPGEIFLTMSKEGSTISGLMDSFATAISLALQYGVPLQTLVDKFAHSRFEPSGITNNPDIRFAKSIMDYIFRWLGVKFLRRQPVSEETFPDTDDDDASAARTNLSAPSLTLLAPASTEAAIVANEKETFQNQADAPICTECGTLMVRNGACFKCLNCGSVFGCS